MKKYVVALSGTHGTGKSTVLKGIKSAGYPVVETQLSRSAQAALGWDKLSRAQESVENMWKLQDALLISMQARDEAINKSRTVTLVERSPADLYAYTKMWCSRLKVEPFDARLVAYTHECRKHYEKFYTSLIIVPMVDEIPFVAEARRADLESREMVDRDVREFVAMHSVPSHVLWRTSIDGRQMEAEIVMEEALADDDVRSTITNLL